MIRLSEDGAKPYSVIITDLRATRGLLRSWQMEMMQIRFDQAWMPTAEDVRQAETIMRLDREGEGRKSTEGRFRVGRLSADIDQYNREYCGFTKGKSRYVVCNMSTVSTNMPLPDNRFTSVMDGGCAFRLVVIALDKRQVLGVMCNGM